MTAINSKIRLSVVSFFSDQRQALQYKTLSKSVKMCPTLVTS